MKVLFRIKIFLKEYFTDALIYYEIKNNQKDLYYVIIFRKNPFWVKKNRLYKEYKLKIYRINYKSITTIRKSLNYGRTKYGFRYSIWRINQWSNRIQYGETII